MCNNGLKQCQRGTVRSQCDARQWHGNVDDFSSHLQSLTYVFVQRSSKSTLITGIQIWRLHEATVCFKGISPLTLLMCDIRLRPRNKNQLSTVVRTVT